MTSIFLKIEARNDEKLLKNGGIIGLQALGRHDDAGVSSGIEDARERIDECRHVGKERLVIIVAADVFESGSIERDGEFCVGNALEADAADLMVEAGRIAHQDKVGTEEESLIKFGGEEAVDEMDASGNILLYKPRRAIAKNNVDVV